MVRIDWPLLFTIGCVACGHTSEPRGEWCGTTQAAMHEMSEKQSQCERGDVDACLEAARMLEGDNLAGFHDADGARRAYARACAAGDQESCLRGRDGVVVIGSRDKTVIAFEPSALALTAEAHAIVGDVVRTLNAHPEITLIEVQGHTTSDESDPMLSQRRAELVIHELVTLGVDASRLRPAALGTKCNVRRPSVTFRLRATSRGPVRTDEC